MKYYKDFYGSTASIKVNRNGTAVLKISDCYGNRTFRKEYSTERGARIALGKFSDCWHEVK